MTRSPGTATELGAGSFGPTPAVSAAGHGRTFEETWAWLEPILPRVPVTRIYDATPLDVLGIPVWSAVTPLARDLTVHAGKGATPLASRISAAMEAVERICAETIEPHRLIRASYRRLKEEQSRVLDPREFALPFRTRWDEDLVVSWVGCYDLMSDSHHWVPADLVVSPGVEGVRAGTETNGLASGNTYTEAVLHALYEVVERDAVAEEEFYLIHHDPLHSPPRPVRLIDPSTLPPESRAWMDRLVDAGLRVQIQDCRAGTDINVFGIIIVDDGYPGLEGEALTFAGYGADLDPERAVLRAVTEAAQAHTGVILGARDEFEGMRPLPERPAMLRRRLDLLYGDGTLHFPAGDGSSGDLHADLAEVLRRLWASGRRRCLVTELTRPDLAVPVVRVLVPGLASPYPDSSREPTPRLLSTVV